ncbi:hypothetical protein PACTADRAFT_5141 [Pachysolen tannophilus NRRL Y-2460]|uniref:Phytanoyl-CoA dioxygenase n=1 Tax=Pachysolen tannophilus NRRL Y-2460 TaxID=669874 RepID=A0A1E4TNL6_PACTA|nr:hypothetical protein PACTADRAFT_5141 [Pachysolen tannophilus NRRL Y-2460]
MSDSVTSIEESNAPKYVARLVLNSKNYGFGEKIFDKNKPGQNSVVPRQIIKNPQAYEEASKTPKVDKSVFEKYERQFIDNGPYNDWRDDLIENGFAVIKGAIPKERAQGYENDMRDWIKSFSYSQSLDFNDRSTWVESNLPSHMPNNIYALYCSSHEKFMWDARQEEGVIDTFAKIWGTRKLLVSFDAFNFGLPNRSDVPEPQPWPHIDQSPFKRGIQCIQGIINLSDASNENDGSLVVYKGSHKLLDQFLDTQTDKSEWKIKDSYIFTSDELKWFLEKGCQEIKVKAEPGDVIVWDSRTVHYGGAQQEGSNQIRSVIYASYSPKDFATEQTLERKKKVFNQWQGTTHWAHDNIVMRDNVPLLANYEIDPEDRSEPRIKPEITQKLLRLAGAIPYDE